MTSKRNKTAWTQEDIGMNNTQLYLIIGIPTMTVILAWLSNRSDINRVNDKLDRLAETLRAEMTALRTDHHKDNMALMGYMVPLHERMAKLESHN
jgi:hypothetical protein